jgi:flagellar motor switch protein FliM
MQFVFDQRLRQSDITRLMPPNEKVLSLSFEIRMPEARGMLNVALPAAVSNALLRKLTQLASYRKQRGTADSTSQIRKHIEHCLFPMELVLPEARVPVSQLLSLDCGDVLKLRCALSESAHLLVSGKKMFRAYPVRSGTRRAAQVDRRMTTFFAAQKESV